MSRLTVITIAHNDVTQMFGFNLEQQSGQTMKELICLEFGLNPCEPLSLVHFDELMGNMPIIIPLEPHSLQHGLGYRLRVYPPPAVPPHQDEATESEDDGDEGDDDGEEDEDEQRTTDVVASIASSVAAFKRDFRDSAEESLDPTATEVSVSRSRIADSASDAEEDTTVAVGHRDDYHVHRQAVMDESERAAFNRQQHFERLGFDPFEDEQYYESYADLALQESMVRDQRRTEWFRTAILGNPNLFKGKVVMDLGCGTGILSFFAAQAGAAHVHAVEASDMALVTQQTVSLNGMQDVITVHHCRAEDLQLQDQVIDILISEWMGQLLVYESMIESVIRARDKWLKPDGVMIPSHANIYAAPVSIDEVYDSKVTHWRDVYGIRMDVLAPIAHKAHWTKPVWSEPTPANALFTEPIRLKHFDMSQVRVTDLELMSQHFDFTLKEPRNVHGFCTWFDVRFTAPQADVLEAQAESPHPGGALTPPSLLSEDCTLMILDTSPLHPPTHWHQELCVMPHVTEALPGDRLVGDVTITRNTYWRRHYCIDVSYKVVSKSGEVRQSLSKEFPKWRFKTQARAEQAAAIRESSFAPSSLEEDD